MGRSPHTDDRTLMAIGSVSGLRVRVVYNPTLDDVPRLELQGTPSRPISIKATHRSTRTAASIKLREGRAVDTIIDVSPYGLKPSPRTDDFDGRRYIAVDGLTIEAMAL